MIKNDLQYDFTKEQYNNFLDTINRLHESEEYLLLRPRKQQIYKDALLGEVEVLEYQLREYEHLKAGHIETLDVTDYTQLPKVLVKSRIANGITEQALAQQIGIDVSELYELEEEFYADADPEIVLRVIDILSVDIPKSFNEMLSKDIDTMVGAIKKSSLKSLFNRILPEEFKDGYNQFNGRLKLLTLLKRVFGIESFSDDLVSNSSPAMAVRFKVPQGANQNTVLSSTSYAYHIAKIVQHLSDIPKKELTTNPLQFKKDLLGKYGDFSLESCIRFMWEQGIPVIPLDIRGGFHGACWRINGRNVIVLKQQSSLTARWMFDLLHEYWHATQEADIDERSVIDFTDNFLINSKDDAEEIDANNFARDVILDKRGDELLQKCYDKANGRMPFLKSAVQNVAEEEGVDVGALANFVAYDVAQSGKKWWGTAQNLQNKGEPYFLAVDILMEKIDMNLIEDDLDRELIMNAFPVPLGI